MSKDTAHPRREFLLTALSLGLFAGANLASLFQAGHARGDIPDKLPPGRSIYKLRGEVTVDGGPANINTLIAPGSVVRTGRKGMIIFVVGKDAFILRSNSQLEIENGDGVVFAEPGFIWNPRQIAHMSVPVTVKRVLAPLPTPMSAWMWPPSTTTDRFTCCPLPIAIN